MADPKLIELARSAEAGHELPLLRISTASQLVIGVPGRSADFSEVTWPPIMDEMSGNTGRGAWSPKRIRQAEQQLEKQADRMWEGWAPAAAAPDPDPPEVLTLYGALVWAWGESSGLRVPALRLSLDAVTVWWVSPGEQMKSNGGNGWIVGALMPIPFGHS